MHSFHENFFLVSLVSSTDLYKLVVRTPETEFSICEVYFKYGWGCFELGVTTWFVILVFMSSGICLSNRCHSAFC